MLTAERARELLAYNPETGALTRRVARAQVRAGDSAGTVMNVGYLQVRVAGETHLGHRLIWLMQTNSWPEKLVDHRDGDPLNNRWSNLRAATRAQNAMNAKLSARNRSGRKGVYRKNGRWAASIRVGGRNVHLGMFDTVEAAGDVFDAAAARHYGEFARAA